MEKEFPVELLLTPEVIKILLGSTEIQDLIIKPNKKESWAGKNDWPPDMLVLLDFLAEKSLSAHDIVDIRNDIKKIKFKQKFATSLNRKFRTFIFDVIKNNMRLNKSFTEEEKKIILSPIEDWEITGNISSPPKESYSAWPGRNFFWTVAQETEGYVNRALFWQKILF